MPGVTFGTGSTATLNAERIRQLFYNFKLLPTDVQTSARWNTDWAARSVRYLDVKLDYLIDGRFGSNSSSWFRYQKLLFGSTRSASAAHQPTAAVAPHAYAPPHPVVTDFTTRSVGMTTLGNSDAAMGRRTFDLWSTAEVYRDSGYEFLLAWAGRGTNTSAGIGSSVRLV